MKRTKVIQVWFDGQQIDVRLEYAGDLKSLPALGAMLANIARMAGQIHAEKNPNVDATMAYSGALAIIASTLVADLVAKPSEKTPVKEPSRIVLPGPPRIN
jgi:hypothetical protein